MTSSQPPPEFDQKCRPGLSRELIEWRISLLPERRREAMTNAVNEVGHDDFWEKPRYVQVLRLLGVRDVHHITQKEIAFVLAVSNALVTRLKQYFELHPDEVRPPTGRPSELRAVFPELKAFVDAEMGEHRSVTKSLLMAYATDIMRTPLSAQALAKYMERHHYSYVSAVPTDVNRVGLDQNKIAAFYIHILPEALMDVHPSLVFNVDEMGAEMFADRKRIFVFVPEDKVPKNGPLFVGVPRSARRCTLLVCISLDGTTLCPTIITRTKTIDSAVFEKGGYDSNNLKIYNTENSFINNEVFGEWLCDVFLPEVVRRRKVLAETLGTFNDRAVLILDGCSAHTMEPFKELLRRYNVTMVFLVPHSSHMSQALDVGIFARCKNLIRNDTKYRVDLQDLDEALAQDNDAENTRVPLPAEKGLLLAEYILKILRSFDQATTPDNVVSAFAQVGIHFRMTSRGNINQRVSYVDPTTARVVVNTFGAIPWVLPCPPEQHRLLNINALNSGHQSALSRQLRQELADIRVEFQTEQHAQQRFSKKETDN